MTKPWTEPELNRLRALYPAMSTARVAKFLRRSPRSVSQTAYKLGLHKTPEYLASPEACRLRRGDNVGKATRFRKGDTPANKGLRRPGWSPGRMKETQFKKGQRTGAAASNWRPIGTILTGPDGYLRIKVREAQHGKEATGFGNAKVWPQLQRHVWTEKKGPIPPGHVIVFKDRNRSNCEIGNLECISRAELAERNRMWGRYPEDLARAIQLNGVLKRKIREARNAE